MTAFLIFTAALILAAGAALFALGRRAEARSARAEKTIGDLVERRAESLKSDFSQAIHQQGSLLGQELHALREGIAAALSDTRQSVQADLKSSGKLMADIHGKLGELGEASRRIHDIGKDIAGLQELLRAPKLRGGIGEFFLEELLAQVLPRACFSTQVAFRDGSVVDAVIQVGERRLCVDSKFPLEAFRQCLAEADPARSATLRKEYLRSVKKHIDDISRKYILPSEGTYPFAFMYIPAENVYYETVVRDAESRESGGSILEYAAEKKVIPVSPTLFYSYLQTILVGMRGFQVQARTQEILARMEGLTALFERFLDDFNLVGKHVTNSGKAFSNAEKTLARFGGEIRTIQDVRSPEPETPAVAAGPRIADEKAV